MVWSQFAPYHSDRCDAVGARLADRYEVLAIEVAGSSQLYAWEKSRELLAASKLTLFADRLYEDLPWPRRLIAMLRALRGCRTVFIGIGYNERDVLVMLWLLRMAGKQVVLMSDSKFDDKARSAGIELAKRLLLLPVSGAIVAGRRQTQYMRSLGVRPDRIVLGYDCVSVARIRRDAAATECVPIPLFAERYFLYVGRFLTKKNLHRLLEGFAIYAAQAGAGARRLRLVGSGDPEEELALRARAEELGITGKVEILGQLSSAATAREMAGALGLILYSLVEQWGLVVNEALALGIPVIVSTPVGARDLLVRDLVNGYVVPPKSVHLLALAMADLAGDEPRWQRMSRASLDRACFGDVEHFVDAVEAFATAGPGATPVPTATLQAELA